MIVRYFKNGINNNLVQRLDHFLTVDFLVKNVIDQRNGKDMKI